MSVLVADCPRCHSQKITFDLLNIFQVGERHNWMGLFEAFCKCRQCNRSTVFQLSQTRPDSGETKRISQLASLAISANQCTSVEGFVSLKDFGAVAPPDHLPAKINEVFKEGAACLSIDCYNAAGAMFRFCVELATRDKLPKQDINGLDTNTRRVLGRRLKWLLNNNHLPSDLHELSLVIKEDGDDGAHVGSLTKNEALDLLDFTTALLERIYTEPKRIELAKQRRVERRQEVDKSKKT